MAIPCTGYFLARLPNPARVISRHGSQTRSGSSFLQGKSLVQFNVDGLREAPLGRLPWMRGTGGSSVLNLRAEAETEKKEEGEKVAATDVKVDLEKDISKVVRKTAATFAPRASSAKNKNPAQPGTMLYTIFEVQAYISMLVGGILSFNLLFPSDHPDIWRLMGMWSVWMFTIPSLRARDCPGKEKEALNYLFLAVPLINVTLPLVWKSFAAVWSADVLAFFAMYTWKLEWLGNSDNKANDSNQ
uniref:Uncharacterized protein n=2 Tax=Physcomitrium patens TaxID=3218 RepID=A0A2K1IH67_PHYPA|nr:hypothetical protein PHYPA_029215 [Physcomitrium patens]